MSETREHWLAVGRVSNAARKQLIEANCLVLDVSSKPTVVLVGLRGEAAVGDFSQNMAFTDMGEIQIRLKALRLCWQFPANWQVAYASVTETELVLNGE
jgi:hypothetical protein